MNNPKLPPSLPSDAQKGHRGGFYRALAGRASRSALFLLFLIAMYVALRLHLQRSVDLLETDIRMTGYPVSIDELGAFYPSVPDNLNAALLFEDAAAELLALNEIENITALYNQIDDLPCDENLPDELASRMRECTERLDSLLANCEAASELEGGRYSLDLSEGHNVELSHLFPLRGIGRLYFFQARLAALDGDEANFIDSQRMLLQIACSLENEPILISQLVRIGFITMSTDASSYYLCRQPLSESALSSLLEGYLRIDHQVMMMRALGGERCMTAHALTSQFYATGPPLYEVDNELQSVPRIMAQVPGAAAWELWERWNILSYKTACMESMDSLVEDSWQLSYPRMRIAGKQKPKYTLLDEQYYFDFTHAGEAFIQAEARLRTAAVALLIEFGRLSDRHNIPEGVLDLPEVEPARVYVDPHSADLLRIVRQGAGYRVYGVGVDLDDDGGAEMKKVDGRYDGDWAFSVAYEG